MAKKSGSRKSNAKSQQSVSNGVAATETPAVGKTGASKTAQPTYTRSATARVARMEEMDADVFWQSALGVLLVGILLRQMWLADFPFHPDEAIHAWFADGFTRYSFDPVYHGPLMYHLLAGTFGFFDLVFRWLHLDVPGANDYTARLVPSLLGIGLLALILFGPLRRWMGLRAVLWSAALLTISPSVTTYSRRLLHDSLVLMLTLGALMFFHRARQYPAWTPQGRNAWFGVALLLTLFLCTKANAFFIIAMLIGFWFATWIYQKLRDSDWLAAPVESPALIWSIVPVVLFAFISIVSIYALRDPETVRERNEAMLRGASVASVGLLWLWLVFAPRATTYHASETDFIDDELSRGETEAATTEPEVVAGNHRDIRRARRTATWRTALVAAWSSVLVFAWLFGHGFLWWRLPADLLTQPAELARRTSLSWKQIGLATVGRAELVPPGPDKDWTDSKLTLPQTVASGSGMEKTIGGDWDGVTMAMPRLISYWAGQQKAPRLPSRHDYYLVLISLYELPIFLLALGGMVWLGYKRSAWGDLLLWWAFTSWVLYAMANEKVPWLLVHTVVPFALIGGWWIAQWRPQTTTSRVAFTVGCALSAIYLLRGTWATNFQSAVANREPMFFAQTSEGFRDALVNDLHQTSNNTNTIWVHNDKQWPPAWYLRNGSPLMNGSGAVYGGATPTGSTRLIITTEDDWKMLQKKPEYQGWHAQTVVHYVWPRASWPALRPDRWLSWWLYRQALPAQEETLPYTQWRSSILIPPGEWSDSKAVFATPP